MRTQTATQAGPTLRAEHASVERLFTGAVLAIARFRCPPGDERWSHENWIGDRPHVVFPHVPVTIRQRGGSLLVADPTKVVLYRTGDHYERERLSPEGDRSTFLTIEPGAGAAFADAIVSAQVTVDADDVLRIRLLAELCARRERDSLMIEEEGLRIVSRVLRRLRAASRSTYRGGRRTPPSTVRRATRGAHERAVIDAQRYLGVNARGTHSLADIGAAVGVSPYHLARLFRGTTGLSLHGYREQLRLRTSLDLLAQDEVDLATLAVDLGFASHSHFDVRFKRAFGRSPSTIRTMLRTGRAKTSTLMEALTATSA